MKEILHIVFIIIQFLFNHEFNLSPFHSLGVPSAFKRKTQRLDHELRVHRAYTFPNLAGRVFSHNFQIQQKEHYNIRYITLQ